MTIKANLGYLIAVVAIVAVAAFALAACGSAAEPTEPPAPAATTAPTAAPEPTAMPQPTEPPAPTAAAVSQPTTTPEPTATARPAPTAAPTLRRSPRTPRSPRPHRSADGGPLTYPAVPGIVDPSNLGWPREVETSEGKITLEGPPQRILTYSLGHDEMVLALAPPERIAALGKFTGNPSYSNVAELAEQFPVYEKGAENVLAQDPDIFIVSRSTKADIVALVSEAGVPVARPDLEDAAEGHISQILLLGIYAGGRGAGAGVDGGNPPAAGGRCRAGCRPRATLRVRR